MTGRRLDYDLLRVLSMIVVVYLHTAAAALRRLGNPLWHFSNLASSLAGRLRRFQEDRPAPSPHHRARLTCAQSGTRGR